MNQFNLIDLFAGCGGLTEGFVSSGSSFNTLAVVEWEKYPLATLKKRLLSKWGYSDKEIFKILTNKLNPYKKFKNLFEKINKI